MSSQELSQYTSYLEGVLAEAKDAQVRCRPLCPLPADKTVIAPAPMHPPETSATPALAHPQLDL
jgi:hypothetical protein